MDRINSINARPNINGIGKRGFHDNADLSGQDATYLTPDFLNIIQEELCNVLELRGISLDQQSRQQLYDALAGHDDLLALADAIEQRLLQYATLINLNTAVQNSLDFASGLIQQHYDRNNPHPQYLLASTFGVSLQMTADLNTQSKDINRVLGWDGDAGDMTYRPTESWSWGTSGSGVLHFKPWRCFGQFLIAVALFWMDRVSLGVTIFDADNQQVEHYTMRNGAAVGDETLKYVANIPKNGRLELAWDLKSSYKKKGRMSADIFVDDRVKVFKPVGYQSLVENTDDFENGGSQQIEDNSKYPNFEWFYYSAVYENYIELNASSTLATAVNNVPHYHRNHFDLVDTDIYVIVEVGSMSTDSPSDYAGLDVEYLMISSDANGDTVIAIPLDMRSVNVPAGHKKVYSIAYYANEVQKTGIDFPVDSLSGVHKIYVSAE